MEPATPRRLDQGSIAAPGSRAILADVAPPLSDEKLMRWVREHLVYEGRMLAYTALRLAERTDLPRDQESNVLLESFAIHARCLRDFLWGSRTKRVLDAFAADFCAEGVWERERGPVPPPLDSPDRFGPEIVHLSYRRLAVPPELKDWPVSGIVGEIVAGLKTFALEALPERLDDETRMVLTDLAASVATSYTGGTIEYPGFSAGS
jgi:hypothetical protein